MRSSIIAQDYAVNSGCRIAGTGHSERDRVRQSPQQAQA